MGLAFNLWRKLFADKRNYISFYPRRGLWWNVLTYAEDERENTPLFAIQQWQILHLYVVVFIYFSKQCNFSCRFINERGKVRKCYKNFGKHIVEIDHYVNFKNDNTFQIDKWKICKVIFSVVADRTAKIDLIYSTSDSFFVWL